MKQQRKHYGPAFKAKVAWEAARGKLTLNELAGQFGVHPNQIMQWKKLLIEGARELFVGRAAQKSMERDRLHQEIIRQSQRTARDGELWMLTVLQGRMSMQQLSSELASVFPRGEAERLYWCVLNNAPTYRKRALALLSHKKDIKNATIPRRGFNSSSRLSTLPRFSRLLPSTARPPFRERTEIKKSAVDSLILAYVWTVIRTTCR